MKKLIFPFILSFTTIYMLFTYEPLVMFAGNLEDFWFDIYTILPSLILITLSLITSFLVFYFILYKLCNKKHEQVFNIVLIIHFIVFMILYINGNYLAKNLKILDGTKFSVKIKSIDMILSIVTILLVIGLVTVLIKKLKAEKTIKLLNYLTIVIFIMLTSGLVYILCTTPKVLDKKDYTSVATKKNIHTYSKDTNLIIYVVDGADSKVFQKALSTSKYKNAFKDFTYYPDTMSTYGNTSNSIPFILTGKWDEKKTDFETYSKNAYKESELFKTLKKENYKMNMYEEDFRMSYEEAKDILNFHHNTRNINRKKFLKEEFKYIKYKYLPYFLKDYSNINSFKLTPETMGGTDQYIEKYDYYTWDNIINYDSIVNYDLKKVESKEFKFFHIEGPHLPFNMDEELNIIDTGTYEQKQKATIKILNAYLTKLKEEKVYNNSIIIFLADHGLSEREDFKGRQNPILLIKGLEEHHDFKTSDKPISFEDLQTAYQELLKGKKSTELFKDIKEPRKRRFLFYPDQYSDTLVEYYQTGKAWKLDTMKETGKTYNFKDKKNAS